MSIKFRAALQLLKDTISEWTNDKAVRLGAALSYYTVFSLPPLLVIIIAIAGLVFGAEAVRGQLVNQFKELVGEGGAAAVQAMIEKASSPKNGIIASGIGAVVLILGATGVFTQLQDALNTIWKVKPKPGTGIKYTLRMRALSFALVLGIGFLLLVSLAISTLLSAFSSYLSALLAGTTLLKYPMYIVSFLISFGIITLLFAMIFKFLPDAEVSWKDVWLGSAVTAFLFTIGKFLIGLYLGKSSVGSAYGAAGSLVIILLWIYYSSQILFFGAEFTQVYANRYGSKIVPDKYAMRTTERERTSQGMEPSSRSSGDGREQVREKERS